MVFNRRSARWWLGAPVLVTLLSCSSTPEVAPVTDAEKDLRQVGFFDPPPIEELEQEADDLEVLELEQDGIRGGGLWFTLPASRARVTQALLDFDSAAGHRSWAEDFKVLERSKDRVVARWFFEGKMGVNPEPVLVFEVQELSDRTLIRYRLKETAFGLAAFFGDYQVLSVGSGEARSIVGERVYIDSGLFFVNASQSEIAQGLREDVRRLREWLGK